MKLILAALIVMTSSSYALFQIEPYLGYRNLSTKKTYAPGTSGTNTIGSIKGGFFGLMAGVRVMPKLRVGYDYNYTKNESRGKEYNSVEFATEIKFVNHGPFVAWDLAKNLSIQYSLYSNSSADPEGSVKQEGQGHKTSLVFRDVKAFNKNLNVMLDYYNIVHDESLGSTTAFENKIEGIGFSITYPIEL